MAEKKVNGKWEAQKLKSPEDLRSDFQTPMAVCKYMGSMVPVEAVNIFEPFPGNGNQVRTLIDQGKQVTAPIDYWQFDRSLKFDAVVTNPPFSGRTFFNVPKGRDKEGMKIVYEEVKHLMTVAPVLILLLPCFSIIDSDVRARGFYKFGLKSVTFLPRSSFGYARIQTCILELNSGYRGSTELKLFTRLLQPDLNF